MIKEWFTKIIHPSIKTSAIDHSYAKNMVGAMVITFFASPFYAYLYGILGFTDASYLILAEGAWVLVSTYICLKYLASVKWARRSIVLSLTLTLASLSYILGGIYNPASYWLVLPPLLAIFFGNLREGVYCTYLCILVIVGLLYRHSALFLDYEYLNRLILIQPISIAGLVFIIAILAGIFEWSKRIAINQLLEARNELALAKERELTAAKNAELKKLDDQNKDLLESTKLKNMLLANMSHEFRTPLTGILGFSELLAGGDLGEINEEQRNALVDIISSSNQLLQMIESLLDLANIEFGAISFRPKAFNLAECVQAIVVKVTPLLDEKHLSVSVLIDPGVTAIFNDPDRTKHILENYISNAIKFSNPNGEIRIRITPEPDHMLRIEVTDQGIGIAKENIDKLFVEFRQLDFSSTKRYRGIGLGLAMVKHIVQAQGGRVGVESTLGQGSTFIAIIPKVYSNKS